MYFSFCWALCLSNFRDSAELLVERLGVGLREKTEAPAGGTKSKRALSLGSSGRGLASSETYIVEWEVCTYKKYPRLSTSPGMSAVRENTS